ncbi:hypothetical protein HWI79_2645 [Cryptosporidium felis]|nr:hypothetical protein HWI79_2645 [Cryptosporidium felis]
MHILGDQNFDSEISELALMELVAKNLHNVFETFQYEANTSLRNMSDKTISKFLEQYVTDLKNVFSESFNNLSTYISNPKSVHESMDMFFFSAYIFELFYVVNYSKEGEVNNNLFKWYLKYGMRDSTSQLVSQLTETTDKFLDLQESGNKVNTEIEEKLENLLSRALLLGEVDLYNSTLWSLFPNDRGVLALGNLLSQNPKDLPPTNRSAKKEIILLKESLPSIVQTSLDALLGNGSVIQSCSESWLEAFVFSSKYVPGISLYNFRQFLSIYLECAEQNIGTKTVHNSVRTSVDKLQSTSKETPEDILEYEVGTLYLLSGDLNKFIVHIYDSSQLYGPFLAVHLFDPLYYEGILEDVALELKSKELRSRVLMNYAIWLIETDLCDPAIYLQECSDSSEVQSDMLKALTLISNKIPLLYEYTSENQENDTETTTFEDAFKATKCEQCILNEYIPDWDLDESISTFLKLIREFIPQIIPIVENRMDISRKLLVERFNQTTLELQKSIGDHILIKQLLLLLEKLVILLELARIDRSTRSSSIWSILECFMNVPPCLFLSLKSEKRDSISRYNFQKMIPEEYMVELDVSKEIPFDKQAFILTTFYSQNGILESLSQLIPEIQPQKNNFRIPPFFRTMMGFSRFVIPVFWPILSPTWNSEKNLWESHLSIDNSTIQNLKLEEKLCRKCLPSSPFSSLRILEDGAETVLLINPNSIPQVLVPLYCLFCLKLIQAHSAHKIPHLNVPARLYRGWMDIFFANAVSDSCHPFINNPNLNSTITEISEKINKSFYF